MGGRCRKASARAHIKTGTMLWARDLVTAKPTTAKILLGVAALIRQRIKLPFDLTHQQRLAGGAYLHHIPVLQRSHG